MDKKDNCSIIAVALIHPAPTILRMEGTTRKSVYAESCHRLTVQFSRLFMHRGYGISDEEEGTQCKSKFKQITPFITNYGNIPELLNTKFRNMISTNLIIKVRSEAI